MTTFYLDILAPDKDEAFLRLSEEFGYLVSDFEHKLVHEEPPVEDEESGHYIFEIRTEEDLPFTFSSEEHLHDWYQLDNLDNHPIVELDELT